jgi:hypothetical protein
VLVTSARFQREFPDHVAMMRELRDVALARTEGGEGQPKVPRTSNDIEVGHDVLACKGPAEGWYEPACTGSREAAAGMPGRGGQRGDRMG